MCNSNEFHKLHYAPAQFITSLGEICSIAANSRLQHVASSESVWIFFFLFNFIQISFQTAKQLLNLGMYFVLYFTSF